MPTPLSIFVRSAVTAVWLAGTAMAQNPQNPPLLEGRVAWQHTIKPDERRFNPRQLLVLADRSGGLFVASLAEAPALPNGSVPLVPAVTHHDPAGRVRWSRQLETTSFAHGRANLAGSLAADGSLWLVIPYVNDRDAPVVMARLGAADGRILQQRAQSFPRDPNVAPDHAGQPTNFLPQADGSVLMLGTAPADGWWLAWRDAAGGSWDLRLEKPAPYAHHAGWFRHQDGSVSLLAFKYPAQAWIMRVSRDGKAGSWKPLPSMTSLLPVGGTLAYLEDEKNARRSRALKTLDPATNRATTLRTSIPPLHEPMNFGPVDLTDLTPDGAFVMRTPWRNRKAPAPQDYREAMLVSRDGQKMWRIPLRMWDQVIDSRWVLQIEPVAGAWQACFSGKCPGWIISLVTYSP
jgi:hypothetical protein